MKTTTMASTSHARLPHWPTKRPMMRPPVMAIAQLNASHTQSMVVSPGSDSTAWIVPFPALVEPSPPA